MPHFCMFYNTKRLLFFLLCHDFSGTPPEEGQVWPPYIVQKQFLIMLENRFYNINLRTHMFR